jgi:actin-like ATPase involved in cell morphogenesis
LKNIVKITVNYITFDGLHDSNSKEVAIHNLCRYFESKLRQKYQALIGE